jgi:peptidoglycan/LPS O-acetylase OafA/YrhL
MVRKIALAALAAVFAMGLQSAQATSPRDRTTLTVVGTGVGAGMTAAYFGINDWRWKWNSAQAGMTALQATVLTTMGCAALSPIVATAVLNRPLSYREAHILIGGCVIPIVGGWLIDQAYENHVLWAPDEPQPAAAKVRRTRHVRR